MNQETDWQNQFLLIEVTCCTFLFQTVKLLQLPSFWAENLRHTDDMAAHEMLC